MRPLIGIVLLVLAAAGLALFASHLHPGGDLPPSEVDAEKDRAAAEAKQEAADKRKALVDHSPGAFDAVKSGAIQATLTFETKTPIKLELYPAAAPKTVARISELIKQGFYNGVKVHRVETGTPGPSGEAGLHLFQFGDPQSIKTDPAEFQASQIGSHGTGTTVPLEIKLPHLNNTIGMARSQDDDSGDCQMYFNTADNPMLDGNYCIFGRVTSGQGVLATIKVGDVIKSFTLQ